MVLSAMKLAAMAALVLAAAIAGTAQADAQEFWRGTRYRMTVRQVIALLPSARPPADPSSLRTGAAELLALPGARLDEESFTAHFYFEQGQLQEVMLLLDGKRRYARLQPVYDRLERALTAKYGAPTAAAARNDSMLQSRSEVWRSGRTKVGLAMLRGGDSANLNIYYRMQ